jgi:NADH dehydrogenase
VNSPHRVVVVGGGFGGLQAALQLRRAPVELTLVDRRNFHLFQPLSYQVATGALSPGEIAYPLRAIFKRDPNVHVVMAEVSDFDLPARELHLSSVEGVPVPAAIPYDTLIVAGGSRYSYFGHDDWREHAFEVKSLESALNVRDRLLSAFEAAEMEPDPERRAAWLTFVVVGAGPTGVEMAGQIAELARDTLRHDFRAIDPRTARILLVEVADRVLTTFPPALSEKAARSLQKLGVSLLTRRTVVGIDGASVTIDDGSGTSERIPSRTVVWAAGVTAAGLGTRLAELTAANPTGPDASRSSPISRSRDIRSVRARRHGPRARCRRSSHLSTGCGAGRHAAGPLRGEGRTCSTAVPPNTAVPLPGQGQSRNHRPGSRGRRHPRAEA